MKTTLIIGVIILILGVAGLTLGGFHYTEEKTPVDLGPLKVKTEENKSVPIPQAVSIVAIIGGIVLVVVGAKKAA